MIRRPYSFGLIATLLFFSYLFFGTFGTMDIRLSEAPVSHYGFLAEGFRLGQTSLSVLPHPELLKLENPYDPAKNLPFRLHDASLFSGKYFLYFGPVPALLFYLPFRWVLGGYPSEALVISLALLAGSLFFLGILGQVKDRQFPHLSETWVLVMGATLGLCNFGPFILARPEFYEVAISVGYALLAGSVFLYFRRQLFLSGFFFALALGCRIHLVLLIPLFLIFHQGAKRQLLLWCSPVATAAVAYAIYNFQRFGNVLEFGQSYQLAYKTGSGATLLDNALQYFGVGVNYYLFKAPSLSSVFPFVTLGWEDHLKFSSQDYSVEPVLGLLWASPFIVASFFGLRKKQRAEWFLAAIGTTLFLFFAIFSVNVRYSVEFQSYFVLVAFIAILRAFENAKAPRALFVKSSFVLVSLYSSILGLLLGMSGYVNNFTRVNPQMWRMLSQMFSLAR